MPVGKLLSDHRVLLEGVASLEALVAGPYPESSYELTKCWWNFTRDNLLHLSKDDAVVLVPLMADRRPHIASLAVQSRAQVLGICSDFQAHVDRWSSHPTAAEWPAYARAVQQLMRRVRARMAQEEAGIYHFLPQQPGGHAERPPINYAGAAWKIREDFFSPQRASGSD